VSQRGNAGPLREGDTLGKYEIVAYLASGGMAELYLARARGIEGFEKVVALKRILPKLAENDEVVTMFLDEARLAATLHHPNLAQVYDIGKEGGSYFFTMEYIHGEDLDTVVRRAAKEGRGLSLSNALFVVTQVAAGLHHAHDKKGADGQPLGTVHRDVSPSNVMVTFDGAVKIVDFGVAKAAARRTKTKSGSIKGKVGYLSPEQARGEEIDRRSDVFALGILLFELTTGTRLFDKQHDYAVLSQLLTKDAPLPSSRVSDYPAELEQIVLRALCRDPEDRYATAQELQLALEDFAREEKLALSSVSLSRFVGEVLGDREDPTATRAVRARSGGAAARSAGTAPETLSGSASRPVIPLERGLPRALWLVVAALVIGAGFLLFGDWGGSPPSSPELATSAAPATASTARLAPSTSTSSRPTDSVTVEEPPANAGEAAGTAGPAASVAPRPRFVAPPRSAAPTASSTVVDKSGAHGDPKPGWNPGSVLPPVVEDD
jgi:serine/threonine protein kinase